MNRQTKPYSATAETNIDDNSNVNNVSVVDLDFFFLLKLNSSVSFSVFFLRLLFFTKKG